MRNEKTNWQTVLDATLKIGRPASTAEILREVLTNKPDFNRANLFPDLSMLSVNCWSRGNYQSKTKTRLTNTGHFRDQLIKIKKDDRVRYAKYDPEIHGVWELANTGDTVLRPKLFISADSEAIAKTQENLISQGMFDPTEDARKRTISTIVQREGQPQFRSALIEAYSGRCAITDCSIPELLEAAHIVPYRGIHTNLIQNGLLLRSDLHKLFDLHLLYIDPLKLTIHLSPHLQRSEYFKLEGKKLNLPQDVTLHPFRDALEHHSQFCAWTLITSD